MTHLHKGGAEEGDAKSVGRTRKEFNRERIIVVAEHVEFKKDSNAAGKTEEVQGEFEDLDPDCILSVYRAHVGSRASPA